MANHTDLFPTQNREQAENAESTVAEVFARVAQHFTTVRPTEALDTATLTVTVGAEAYNVSGRSLGGRVAALSRAALTAAPEAPEGITRGEYALHVRKAAQASGHEWTKDDNQRVIPIIPGQRPAPMPSRPEQSDTPTCCGRAMTRDGQQWLCGTCQGWHDLGGGK